jgi:Rieske Fe-S protein
MNWFLGTSTGALFVSIVYPVFRFISPPNIPEAATAQVEAGPVNDPEIIEKGFKIIRFGADPVILIRAADGDFRAFAGTCTHLDCIVEFQSDQQRIWCNCHNGEYNLSGQVVAGPPPKPLEEYKVDLVPSDSGPQTVVISRI